MLDLKSFNIPVKHFMINLSYLQTTRILQEYYYPGKKSSVKEGLGKAKYLTGKESLNDSAYMTE